MVTNTYPVIMPIGFIKVPSGVTCLAWKPQCVNNTLHNYLSFIKDICMVRF